MNVKRVAILTGYYNRSWCVNDSMLSLINQTYPNSYIFAFDDCSTDSTFKELEKFNSDRFKSIKLPNNMGFVNGLIWVIQRYIIDFDYLLIHGSGDVALPNLVFDEVQFLDANPSYVAVSCQFNNIDPKSGNKSPKLVQKDVTQSDLQFDSPISHGGTMFRLNSYFKCGGYNPVFKYCQDYDLWLRLIKIGKIGVVQKILYNRISQIDGASVKIERFIEQCQYKILALKLSDSTIEERVSIIQEFQINGFKNIVSIFIPEIQRKIFRNYNVNLFRKYDINYNVYMNNSRFPYNTYYYISYKFTGTFLLDILADGIIYFHSLIKNQKIS